MAEGSTSIVNGLIVADLRIAKQWPAGFPKRSDEQSRAAV
jgi:hypothetical protein